MYKFVIFKPHCAGKNVKRSVMEEERWEPVLTNLKDQGYQIFQVGLSENNLLCKTQDFQHTTPFKLTDRLLVDLKIEDLCTLYAMSGLYVGVDTGDYHLMLAAGGRTIVYYPEQSFEGYTPELWHYPNKTRATYVPFNEGKLAPHDFHIT